MNLRIFLPLLLATATATTVLAQPEPDTSQWPDGRPGADFNVVDAKGLKQGRWIRVYPNGKLYYSGSFENSRPVGHFTFFRETGKVLSEVRHQADSDIAKAVLYREDGTESHRGHYLTVQVDGEWTQWKDGEWTALDRRDRVRVVEHYTRDTLDGPTTTFHPNGTLLEEGTYAMGLKNGVWKAFDREGRPRGVEHWRNGQRNGPAQVMQDGGAMLSEGQFTSWHDAGEWTMVPAEAGGGSGIPPGMVGPGRRPGAKPDAPMRRELRNQPMKEVGEYTAGVKDGTWRYFDEQGNTIRTERWSLGRLESTDE